MHELMVVAENTFKETVRDKILYNLVVFAFLLIGISVLLGTLTIGEQARIVNDFGLAAINLVAIIIAIFIGTGLVTREIDRRTIYTILARPITRVQFIIGKYAGLGLIVSTNIAMMFAMFIATVWLSGHRVHGALFQAVELIVVESLLVMAIALFFSTFSSTVLSATMTLGLYLVGHLTSDLKEIAGKSENQATEIIMNALYYVCPNLQIMNIKGQAASGIVVDFGFQAVATAYGLLYAGILLTGACVIFQRRDF
ncbi:putative ABC transport system, permease component [Nitrospira sp. KM1]|uniref:ABC transporter permease n=1 Tax=Nitrospira sp. KM1 TaxID=1936990 RepID=UPI0013A79FE5|nr:ABC transporter permease subunit [Nitrospira sp. KM1]BCA54479.1 putative ABC transport system, permease component [Nitrospira sp. KM1]